MNTTTHISNVTRDYIIAHINDRPRTALAQAAGVSLSTLYRVVRENGGELDYSRCCRHPQWWDTYIIEHYPNEASVNIAHHLGTNKGRVNKIARELGVKHSDDFIMRQKATLMKKLKKSRSKMDYKAIAEKRKQTRRRDELRAEYGLTRKTKFRFKQMPIKLYKVIWHLTTKYNYLKYNANQHCLLFNSNTSRVNEEYYMSKYGLKFQSA